MYLVANKGKIVCSTAGDRRSQAMGAWAVDILIDGELVAIRLSPLRADTLSYSFAILITQLHIEAFSVDFQRISNAEREASQPTITGEASFF